MKRLGVGGLTFKVPLILGEWWHIHYLGRFASSVPTGRQLFTFVHGPNNVHCAYPYKQLLMSKAVPLFILDFFHFVLAALENTAFCIVTQWLIALSDTAVVPCSAWTCWVKQTWTALDSVKWVCNVQLYFRAGLVLLHLVLLGLSGFTLCSLFIFVSNSSGTCWNWHPHCCYHQTWRVGCLCSVSNGWVGKMGCFCWVFFF